MRIWLVQRGKFKDTAEDAIVGLDSLVSFDYMGSSEFEFGALPTSLKRMVAVIGNFVMAEISEVTTAQGQTMYLFCAESKLNDSKACALHLSKEKYGYKEYCDMPDFIAELPEEPVKNGKGKKQNYVHRCRNNFWWDISNDYMIVFGRENADKLELAMAKLKEKWGM